MVLPPATPTPARPGGGQRLYGQYGNACIDRTVDQYLSSVKLPARDASCAPQDADR
ncbi:alpha/beta hydrolase [Streptomyces sp. NPDC101181]|uniref:alpha/beta hydrolase n=1 Tax=Streptomyces sp. NPDC101181 TaxID=3366125 RepID=UPI003804CE83